MSTDTCGCAGRCGCGSPTGTGPETNLPGQASLRWRVAPHGAALDRMRDWLAEAGQTLQTRALANQSTTDAGVALLDSWAVVTDVVSFYTERVAQEGFLRTATEAGSVRQLARALDYELRPGVAATVPLVFEAETAVDAPEAVAVPAGTPVQTVPAPGKLPQTFETGEPLEVRGAWNAIEAEAVSIQWLLGVDKENVLWLAADPKVLPPSARASWRGAPVVQAGDRLLLLHRNALIVNWAFPTVVAVDSNARPGWLRVDLTKPKWANIENLELGADSHVYRFIRRLNVFGWNAPDRGLLKGKDGKPLVTDDADEPGLSIDNELQAVDLDGDQSGILSGSWIVLEGRTEAGAGTIPVRVTSVAAEGATKYALTGRITRLTVEPTDQLSKYYRRATTVHTASEDLPATWTPSTEPVGKGDWSDGKSLDTIRTSPTLPVGRLVVVTGATVEGGYASELRTVIESGELDNDFLRLTFDAKLAHSYHAETVRVHGNVVRASHGETVEQVLGSGDGRVAFPKFVLRRAPLAYLPTTTTPTGTVAALEVRVEDVAWTEVPTLRDASPTDQVYTVRQSEDGRSTVTFGDGVHGSRLPTGVENVRARYRVGIGSEGEAEPDQISLLVRRPRGISKVTNLIASSGYVDPEDLESARTNAPLRIRTLDRAVSVADYQDFARGYARVGWARADLVWDGFADTVVLSVLDAAGDPADQDLIAALRDTLDAHREARAPRLVLPGEVLDVQVSLGLTVDRHYEADKVKAAATEILLARFGSLDLVTALTASAVLVVVVGVEGVVSATMPTLALRAPNDETPVPLPGATRHLLAPQPGRFAAPDATPSDASKLLPAQALRLSKVVLK